MTVTDLVCFILIREETPDVVETTAPYIPDDVATEPTTTTIPVDTPDNIGELEEICEKLHTILDSPTVYVAKSEKLVVFGSESQDDIDKAKAFCEENGISSDLVCFILIREETPAVQEKIKEHTTIIQMLNEFIKEQNLNAAYATEDEMSGKVAVFYYYIYPEQVNVFNDFIAKNNIDENEVTFVVNENVSEVPNSNYPEEELPQTGYPNIYKALAGVAFAMTVTGTAMIARSKKKDEE